MATDSTIATWCKHCGYSLRGLDSARCPECGRSFDLADPRSFHLAGRPPSRVGRWLCRPPTLAPALGALVVLGTLLYLTPLNTLTAHASVVDVGCYAWPLALAHLKWLSAGELAYVCAIYLLGFSLVGAIKFTLLRMVALRVCREPAGRMREGRRRLWVCILALIASLALVLLGWPGRVARFEAIRVLGMGTNRDFSCYTNPMPGSSLSYYLRCDEAQGLAITRAAIRLRNPSLRLAGLTILVEDVADSHERKSMAILAEAISNETDSQVLRAELYALASFRRSQDVGVIAAFLDSADSTIAAAAADAIAILHGSARAEPMEWKSRIHTATNPPVFLFPADSYFGVSLMRPATKPAAALTQPLRDRLERMMLGGATVKEREAGARALVTSPPVGYQLRLAEWGVWLTDSAGQPKFVDAILDESPPFVHRTGNPLAEFQSRVRPVLIVTKPVVHLTADRAMSVNLAVRIRNGRPYLAYPRPDDFRVWVNEDADYPLASLDRPLPALTDLWVDCPELLPHHVTVGPVHSMSPYSTIDSLGLRWQSLIVSPTKLPWMNLAQVPSDPKYKWWSDLRDVGTSYVCSRNETERFLYYDGPTLAVAAVKVTRDGDTLLAEPAGHQRGGVVYRPGKGLEAMPARRVIVVRVDSGGACTANVLAMRGARGYLGGNESESTPAEREAWARESETTDFTLRVPLASLKPADPEALLGAELLAAGLTAGESAGLLSAWRHILFKTPGLRALVMLSPGDYDTMCPMEMKPAPTQRVRVGILWTELK